MSEVSIFGVKSKYEFEVKINLTGLDIQYVDDKLHIRQKVNVLNYFHGDFHIRDADCTVNDRKCIAFYIRNVDNIIGNILKASLDPKWEFEDEQPQMQMNDKKSKFDEGFETALLLKRLRRKQNSSEKLKSISITIQVSFEARPEHIQKQTLIQGFSAVHKFFLQKGNGVVTEGNYASTSKEVKVLCGNETILFDKDLLCSVSDVFRTMFDNPNNVEYQSGSINIEEVDPNTIISFKNLLQHHHVNKEDLNVATLLFADRYNVQPIVRLCIDHLKFNITKDNFPEIVRASDLINDKGLLCAAVDFASKNIGTFEDDPDVKKFIRTNQDSFIKVFEEMMFKK